MKTVIFATSALADLDDIWFYIAQDNIDQADIFVDGIATLCTQKLARFPQMGKSRDYLCKDIMAFPHQDYMIYYRMKQKSLEVIRIMHGSVDVSQGI